MGGPQRWAAMPSLLDRFRKRKLVQWALAYLAGAWLLLQVLHLLGATYAWPPLIMRSAPVLLAIGFLAALVIAWYHGEKGSQRVSGMELLMLSGILVVAAAAVAFVRGDPEAAAGRSAPAEPSAAALRPELAPLERSIAVLPLTNLSGDPEDEYFSDGITDEIITTLSGIRDLRVISRTSVMRYKDTEKSLREIADELGVTHVLVSSGQRDGERVRIRAQLIDAGTDTNLWAARYDRPLEDIFAVQSDIAQQIARALQATLTPTQQERLDKRPTTDLTAHDYVLQARHYLRHPIPRNIGIALSLFRRALELDPAYADASTGLAAASYWQYFLDGDRAWLDSAVVAAQRALSMDPEFTQGYVQLGWALDLRGEREAALEAHRRAVNISPNVSDGLANVYHFGFGRLDDAARWWGPVLRTDPTDAGMHWRAAWTYLHLGMFARARVLLERAVELQPETAWPRYHLALTHLLEGRRDEARTKIQRMLAVAGDDPSALLFAGHAAMALGDSSAARSYFEGGLTGAPDWNGAHGALALAWILQRSGETERARAFLRDAATRFERRWGGHPRRPEDYADLARIRVLEGDREAAIRALEAGVQRGWRILYERPNDPIFDSLRGDPRYDRLIAEVEADIARMRERVEREGW
jgi:TolB-like protein/Flp pilus assembly protein TadD